jgi:hypothetical protein
VLRMLRMTKHFRKMLERPSAGAIRAGTVVWASVPE